MPLPFPSLEIHARFHGQLRTLSVDSQRGDY